MERLDSPNEKLIKELVDKTFKFMDETIPKSEKYSILNMQMNVLVGCMVSIALWHLPKESRPDFIKQLIENVQANFEANP